ncbi:MAG: acyl-CoA thioesterase [Clostridiales bacterium]|nr:acyl-CoA thioesterase [Clostridiales bacterium]
MNSITHRVNYYETDRMGITHHSNYIRWMEEARVAFLDQLGYGYLQLEAEGVISPVVGIDCQYKRPTTFDDRVHIKIWVEQYNGVKLIMKYEMTNEATGDLVLTATSVHCFVDQTGKPLILKKKFPALDKLFHQEAEASKK